MSLRKSPQLTPRLLAAAHRSRQAELEAQCTEARPIRPARKPSPVPPSRDRAGRRPRGIPMPQAGTRDPRQIVILN